MYPKMIDVTNVTGARVNTALTAWITPDGNRLVEHLAGCAPNGDLLVFYWLPGQDWRVVNVTQITGQRVDGPVTSWVVPNGNLLVEHLAGRAPNGDLLVFYWMPGQDWRVVNVSQITGRRVNGPVTSWVTPNGNLLVEHLAGQAPNGELLVFYWMPGQDWKVVSVTQITGQAVAGPVTSWVTPDGNDLVEHLAGRSPNGDLLVFYWTPENDWRVVNVSAITETRAAGPFCSWTTWNGNRLVEHVAGPNDNGDLLVFYWMPGQDWKVVDVSKISGVKVQGRPRPYQVKRDGMVEELLAVQGHNGSLYNLWWSGSLDWQAMDFKEAAGVTYGTAPEVWSTADGNRLIEHIAAADRDDHLIVSWFDAESRQITDKLVDDFAPLAQQRGKRRRLVVILWDPQRPGHPAPPRAAVENAFMGAANSVRQFFRESSLDRFNFEVVEFLPPSGPGGPDWYTAQKPGAHYWDNPDPQSANPATANPNYHHNKYQDGWLSGHVEKYAEAVWMAANDFNFSAYDFNGDGKLDPNDLRVCMMVPQSGSYAGFQRTPSGQQLPNVLPLRSNGVNAGVVIPSILEIYMGSPVHVGLIAHELAHLLVDAGDLYHGWPPESEYVPFTIGPFSLMAAGTLSNLDPFHRLKYGWLRHRLVMRSGRYRLRAAAAHGEALVLLDPAHSKKEYFLLENRWNAPNTCDAPLPDAGLAVWHIIEDSAIFNLSPTPAGTSANYWNGTVNSWGRRGVRLIRPVVTPPNTNNAQALWDGSQAATGYDLLSNDPNPQHSELRWVSNNPAGNPSGFAIRNISAAGPEMTIDIEVP